MTNNFEEEPWYPQLPEGYTGEAQGVKVRDGRMDARYRYAELWDG